MKKKRLKWLYEPVFKMQVYILICPQKELDKELEKIKKQKTKDEMPSMSDGGGIYTMEDKDGCVSFMVWFCKEPRYADIVHEAKHLADKILEHHEVVFHEEENNEVFAYYTEYWFETIRKALK